MFHGFLHKDLQGWFDPVLINLTQEEASVTAEYRVSYQGLMTKLLGLNKQGVDVTTRTISIKYDYPHYRSELEGLSSLYLMRSPVGTAETKSFSFLFVKVNLPQWLLKLIKPFGYAVTERSRSAGQASVNSWDLALFLEKISRPRQRNGRKRTALL